MESTVAAAHCAIGLPPPLHWRAIGLPPPSIGGTTSLWYAK